ncbi:M20 family metallopeptidase [Paenarthrobacter sp. NPDC090520]|uniref:M20 metallopeptidase family protein n=1 Tax=Paenarthrobacter sp. NPDC090520 TaxID=3364382 RepID=UPI0038222146
MNDLLDVLQARLDEELVEAYRLREELHRFPHVSGAEGPTCQRLLNALPLEATVVPVAQTGALVRVGGTGPAVALRAELDALPTQETTGLAWSSEHPHVMHACGHDVHMAAAVALARAVADTAGTVPLLLILQPREETYPSGAKDICTDKSLDNEEVIAAIGAHLQPLLPKGTVACTTGAVNASSDEFKITVDGQGGHAAYPHLTVDPVLTLAQLVVALQSIISRTTDPMESAVLSVTTLSAGSAPNVVPGTATARGTVRAMSVPVRKHILGRLEDISKNVAAAHGCSAHVEITHGEPVLENDQTLALTTRPLLQRMGLEINGTLRSAGSDDFAYFCEKYPSLMMFVGTDDQNERLHSSSFAPDNTHVRDVAYAMLSGYAAAASLGVTHALTRSDDAAVIKA